MSSDYPKVIATIHTIHEKECQLEVVCVGVGGGCRDKALYAILPFETFKGLSETTSIPSQDRSKASYMPPYLDSTCGIALRMLFLKHSQ